MLTKKSSFCFKKFLHGQPYKMMFWDLYLRPKHFFIITLVSSCTFRKIRWKQKQLVPLKKKGKASYFFKFRSFSSPNRDLMRDCLPFKENLPKKGGMNRSIFHHLLEKVRNPFPKPFDLNVQVSIFPHDGTSWEGSLVLKNHSFPSSLRLFP